jgi:hypothetical protein
VPVRDPRLPPWLATVILLVAVVGGLYALCRALRRRRPALQIGAPVAVALLARLGCVALFSTVHSLSAARGPDENQFLITARALAGDPGSIGSLPGALVGKLQIWMMTAQIELFGNVGDIPLRVTQVGIAVAALSVLAAAVSDLGGPRAGMIAAWLLALEPGNVFFAGILHRDSGVLLAEALAALGGVRMLQVGDRRAIGLLVTGVIAAVLLRPQIGAALAIVAVLLASQAAIQRGDLRRRKATAAIVAAALAAVVIGVAGASSPVLRRLQKQQTEDATQSNLKLEPVDYSSPGAAVLSLPGRVGDLILRPHPWAAENTSQRLGVAGTLIAWFFIVLGAFLVGRRPREAIQRVAPLLYVLAALVVTYALSTANAGTGFRYRTHVLAIVIAIVSTLLCERLPIPERSAKRARESGGRIAQSRWATRGS